MKAEKVPDGEEVMTHKGGVFWYKGLLGYELVLFLSDDNGMRLTMSDRRNLSLYGEDEEKYQVNISSDITNYRIVKNED